MGIEKTSGLLIFFLKKQLFQARPGQLQAVRGDLAGVQGAPGLEPPSDGLPEPPPPPSPRGEDEGRVLLDRPAPGGGTCGERCRGRRSGAGADHPGHGGEAAEAAHTERTLRRGRGGDEGDVSP